VVLITDRPRQLSARALSQIDTVAIVGRWPQSCLTEFCEAAGRVAPSVSEAPLSSGEILLWRLKEPAGPLPVRVIKAQDGSAPQPGKTLAATIQATAPVLAH
jgi:hypothetical protein